MNSDEQPDFSVESCRQCLASIAELLPTVSVAAAAGKMDGLAEAQQMAKALGQLNWMLSAPAMRRQQRSGDLWAVEKGMLDSGLVSSLVDLLLALLNGSSKDTTANNLATRVMLRFLYATDRSLDFCHSFVGQAAFFQAYYPSLLNRHDGARMLDLATSGLVECAIGIAYNLYFKNNSDLYRQMAEYSLVDCTKPYLASPVTRVSATALVFMAFAVDERQAELFLGAKKSINYLIGILRLGLKAPERACDGYTVMEVAKCINRLALNDANKDLLIELNVLSVVKLMLDSDNTEDVQEGLEILFTLSFSEQNSRRIWTEFRAAIERLAASERWKNSRQLRGLQFRLGDRQQQQQPQQQQNSVAKPEPQIQRSRVMISYNHGCKQQVQKLYQRLTDSQLEVWVDFKHLREGSTLDAMSEAVESSSVVLLCVTRLYKESNNCRLEAEYAWKCNKKLIPLLMEPKYKATGWLGMLMGTQLYFDLTETKCTFEEKFSQLLPAILGHLNAAPSSSTSAAAPVRPPSATSGDRRELHRIPTSPPLLPPIPAATDSQQPSAAAIRSWDACRVTAWCRDNRLPGAVSEQGLTGAELSFLLRAMSRSPEFFGRLLERYFQFTRLHEMAAFVGALEDLAGPQQP